MVNYERKIISAAIQDSQVFKEVEENDAASSFSEHGKFLWDTIGTYYSRDDAARSADSSLLEDNIREKVRNPKQRDLLVGYLGDCVGESASGPNLVAGLRGQRLEKARQRLAEFLLVGSEDKNDELQKALAEFQAAQDGNPEVSEKKEETRILQGAPLSTIVGEYSAANLIPVMPESLNQRLGGGLPKGSHLIVFARPEMGKTAFLINAIAGFVAHNNKVLYVGNEDPQASIVMRLVSRLTGLSEASILSDPDGAYMEALNQGYDLVTLADLHPGTPEEIDKIMREYGPFDALVVDQLRNLRKHGEENIVRRLEECAAAVRSLGKKHNCLVLSATQAGDSGSNRQFLEMGDVDSSNTGIPAQADVMLGIGTGSGSALERGFSLPKNKRTGKHENWFVTINPAISRME